jgi:hypothetical protein
MGSLDRSSHQATVRFGILGHHCEHGAAQRLIDQNRTVSTPALQA